MTEVLTIDGPSGVGKGTISEYLSDELKWNYLNSGALYRSIAWVAKNDSIELNDITELENASKNILFSLQNKNLHVSYKDIEIGLDQRPRSGSDLLVNRDLMRLMNLSVNPNRTFVLSRRLKPIDKKGKPDKVGFEKK